MREVGRKPLADGEALLKIAAAGICGTDISIYRGDYPVSYPLVLGHEFTAVVAEAPRASGFREGERVVCEINNSCIAYGRADLCTACRRGMPTHCLRRTVTGIINHPGAFAEYLKVPAGNLHRIPDALPDSAAFFVEPLAAAIRTFELTPINPGDTVVILGCGRLGRLAALVAQKHGARVIAVGRKLEHLRLIAPFCKTVLRLKSDEQEQKREQDQNVETISPDHLRTAILDLTAGLGADVVVEATANNQSLNLASQLVRPLGTVAMKSTSGVPVGKFDSTFVAVHELRLQGSRCGPFDKAIAFLLEHGIPNAGWVTAMFPLARAEEAIIAAQAEPKVVLGIDLNLASGFEPLQKRADGTT